jgi:dUTP pyrophosphatase
VSINYDATTDSYIYGSGLAFEIPKNYVGLLFPRSSICKTDLVLSNSVGILDSGYRGEVKFVFKNNKDTKFPKIYSIGDRVGQMLVMPYPKVIFEETEELSTTERNDSGFGSSGT